MIRRFWENVRGVLAIIGLIWLLYFISKGISLDAMALQPRSLPGLRGVLFMPLVHQDMNQILSNTVPLSALLVMLRLSAGSLWRTVLPLTICSGLLLWMFGRSQSHWGSGMLIYALAAWLITAGFLERRLFSVLPAVLVVVSFGPLFWQMFPTAGSHVVWESHLFGAVAGVVLARLKFGRRKPEAKDNNVSAMPTETAPLDPLPPDSATVETSSQAPENSPKMSTDKAEPTEKPTSDE